MQDSIGRKINYLRLSVTDLCNHRCIYCMPEEGIKKLPHEEILSIEELAEIGRAAVECGVTKIRLTGGEPLKRRGILELCRLLREATGLKELDLTTNGSLLPKMALPLREAGVDRLNISLNTLKPERFSRIARGGSLAEVLEGIEAAREAGFQKLKINVVLMGGINDDEIADFVALTKDRGDSVRFIELMPMGPCASWEERRFLPAEAVLAAVPELEKAEHDGVAECYRLPGAVGSVGLIRPMSACFCEECSRIRVTADGRLKPCLHSDAELRLRGLHGEELKSAILRGVREKPQRHLLTENRQSETHRTMNQIGG